MLWSFFTGGRKPATHQDFSIRRRLDEELFAVLCRQTAGGALWGALTVLAMGLLLLQVHPASAVMPWVIALCLVYGARWLWAMRMARLPRGRHTRRDLVPLDALMLAAGVGWGLSAWLFHLTGHPVHRGVLMFTLAGLMGFGAQTYTARRATVWLFTFPIALGLLSRLLADGRMGSPVAAAFVVLFFVICLYASRGLHLNLRHLILLRLEKDQLVRTLTDAKERAEESLAAKSDFLATMSHEIRTPMNGLMGMLEVLRGTQLTSQQLNYLTTASHSAEALLQLLNDVLDYSKIEVGKLEFEIMRFDWIALVGELALLNRVLAMERGIGFHLDIPPDAHATVMGDPTRVRQILNNLLSNALKFTHEGSVTLVAEVTGDTDAFMDVRFRVRDTGIGIEPEAQGRLFQQFQQADVSMSRKYGGTGLGLAISQRLAHGMGGRISFTSQLGSGSEFVLDLRFPKTTAEHELAAPRTGNAGTQFSARALVVEDDAVSQRVAALVLKSFGIVPTVVDNGHAAIEQVTGGGYDLVFMDSNMPGLSGFDAARAIRDRLGPGHPVIVALTGANSTEERTRARAAGMDDYLTKPLRKREMRLCLERWLQPAGAGK